MTIQEVGLQWPKDATRSIFGPQLSDTSSIADFLDAKSRSTVLVMDDGALTGQPEVVAIGTVKRIKNKSCM